MDDPVGVELQDGGHQVLELDLARTPAACRRSRVAVHVGGDLGADLPGKAVDQGDDGGIRPELTNVEAT